MVTRDLKHLREAYSLKDDVVGFGTIALLLLAIWLASCERVCPAPLADYTLQRNALIALYDQNGDHCVSESEDVLARDAIIAARGAVVGFNGWRGALGQGCP